MSPFFIAKSAPSNASSVVPFSSDPIGSRCRTFWNFEDGGAPTRCVGESAASFVKRGLVPDGGGLYTLPRRIGLQLTKELIYSGRTVGAEEALRIRLADRLAEPGKLLEATREFAAQFTENSRSAIALMKSVVNRTFETPFELISAQGRAAQAISYTTDEHRASVEQFLKPKPKS